MRLVIMGLPGAGKGTQAALLSEKFGIPHISTGAMFRAAKGAGGPLAQKIAQHIDQGELVPDGLALAVVRARLEQEDCRDGFLLDGFPRTVSQARMFEQLLDEMGIKLDAAIDIVISADEAVRRIVERKTCPRCGATYPGGTEVCSVCQVPLAKREDDDEPTARKRLLIYEEQTWPLVEFYRERGLLLEVHGEGPIDQVFHRVLAQLRGLQADEVLG